MSIEKPLNVLNSQNPSPVDNKHSHDPHAYILDCFPQDLEITEKVTLHKHYTLYHVDLKEFQLTTYFDYHETIGLGIQGEIQGHAFGQLPEVAINKLEITQPNFVDMFSEMNNIIVGQFLSTLEKKHSLLSEHHIPIVYPSRGRIRVDQFKQKSALLNHIIKNLDQYHIAKIGYDLKIEDLMLPFHIILLFNDKLGNNV